MPKCEQPGCGLEKVLSDKSYPTSNGFQRIHACPRNADAHALCARVAKLEAELAAADRALIATNRAYQRHVCTDGYCYIKQEHPGVQSAIAREAARKAEVKS